MRTKPIVLLLVVFIAATVFAAGAGPTRPEPAAREDGVSLYFSPNGGCEAAIIDAIASARSSVDVQAYSFTNTEICRALIAANKRGVKVRVVLDKSNETSQYSAATFLLNNGIKPMIDDQHAIAHNKIILIDGATIITGSYNFSNAAEDNNAENLLILRNKTKLSKAYADNFTAHLKHARAYTRPKVR